MAAFSNDTEHSEAGREVSIRVPSHLWWILLIGSISLTVFAFRDGLGYMVHEWSRAEYSHGYLIPLVSLYLIWRQRDSLLSAPRTHCWLGTCVILFGLTTFVMGELGTIYTVIQYSFLIVVYGISLTFFGLNAQRFIVVPLIYLAFMVPLPDFFYANLSLELQLISSKIGVAIIRFFEIPVFLEGNVIDLGVYKLQVVDACSGLRYLFPLMSFGFLCAHLFKGSFVQKSILFLSTIPITILMNSFRIGVIGVLVEFYGIEMAEGFLHDFEGWFIFMACLSVLFFEIWIFVLVDRRRGGFFERFGFEEPRPVSSATIPQRNLLPQTAALALIAVIGFSTAFIAQRPEMVLARNSFDGFPLLLDQWRGQDQGLTENIVNALKVDDYLLADYRNSLNDDYVNLYVAYYDSQRKGQAVHSPQSCIPGDGWEITSLSKTSITEPSFDIGELQVNRVIIQKGQSAQLVYYWFPQRDRFLTNEYEVKWYIFWDALTRNRTDGALVRLITPIMPLDGVEGADRRLQDFAKTVFPELQSYLPG